MIFIYVKSERIYFHLRSIGIKGFGFRIGLGRAFIEMTLGCVAYEISEKFLKNMTSVQIVLAKIAHVIMVAVVIAVTCLSFVLAHDFLMIGCCFVMITLTFARLSFFAELYDWIPAKKFEAFSLGIYLHYLIVQQVLFHIMNIHNIFIYFAGCALFAIVMIITVNRITALVNKRVNKGGL